MKRGSGVLLHISSLPGPFGIGTIGKEAYEFVDALHAAQQTYWQILPCTPPEMGDSPYTSTSAFAGNPNFIDLEALVEEGLLEQSDLDAFDKVKDATEADFGINHQLRPALLLKASKVGIPKYQEEFEKFKNEQGYWLYDYALFEAIRQLHDFKPYWEWPEGLKNHDHEAVMAFISEHAEEMDAVQFTQFIWFEQWLRLKAYANRNNVQIIGDMPIYVSANSASAWAHPEMFRQDAVAGTPPDAFAPDGQNWGNPIYDWGWMEHHGFEWWVHRLGHSFWLFDWVRFDHFRGIESYFAIPKGEPASMGRWDPGPAKKLIDALKYHLGELRVIAEDLGALTWEVHELLDYCGFAGTKVLQFAFDDPRSCYLPHYYPHNCVCYTGTHDNNTTLGWFESLTPAQKRRLTNYVGPTADDDVNEKLIRLGMMSVANCFIVPMQDLLNLGTDSRMNIPGVAWGNWRWRMPADAMNMEMIQKLCKWTRTYGRGKGEEVCDYECSSLMQEEPEEGPETVSQEESENAN